MYQLIFYNIVWLFNNYNVLFNNYNVTFYVLIAFLLM